MNDVPSPGLRVGDDDRERALSALGEHMSAGRIDIDEYGERSAKVAAARTRGELAEVFADLPAPHPVFGAATPAAEPRAQVQPARSTAVARDERPVMQRVMAGLVPLAFIAGFALFFTVGGWWWFALPFVVLAVGQGFWGKDWEKDPNDRGRRHDRRYERHRRRYERDHRRDDRDWYRS